jgi:hypothetical protein
VTEEEHDAKQVDNEDSSETENDDPKLGLRIMQMMLSRLTHGSRPGR